MYTDSIEPNPLLVANATRLQDKRNALLEKSTSQKNYSRFSQMGSKIYEWADSIQTQSVNKGFIKLNNHIDNRLLGYETSLRQIKKLSEDIQTELLKDASYSSNVINLNTLKRWYSKLVLLANTKDAYGFLFGSMDNKNFPIQSADIDTLLNAKQPPTELIRDHEASLLSSTRQGTKALKYNITAKEAFHNLLSNLQKISLYVVRNTLPDGMKDITNRNDFMRSMVQEVRHITIRDLSDAIMKNSILKNTLMQHNKEMKQEIVQAHSNNPNTLDPLKLSLQVQEMSRQIKQSSLMSKKLMQSPVMDIFKNI